MHSGGGGAAYPDRVMAASSFRDRFFTPRVARAIVSPLSILLGVAVAAIAIAAGLPWTAAVPLGVAAWAGRVLWAVPRRPRRERLDPFTLQEPWRRYVQKALQARSRFDEAVGRTLPGPLRDHLREIADRMQTGVDETWLIAKRGQTLVEARRGINVADVDRQLATVAHDDPADRSVTEVTQSLEAQRATADRLDRVIDQANAELRTLGARLDEAVARTLELSAHASTDDTVGGLSTDVDNLVTEMESLRLALEDTNGSTHPGLAPGGTTE
jgi:hypothetical protein